MDTCDSDMVLLVDDHELTRRAVAVLLRSSGFDVRTATSGRAALHFLRLFRPHAVVLDLALPDMNGVDVLKWLRMNPILTKTPVLIFSGDRDGLTSAKELRPDLCLAKGAICWNTLVDALTSLTNQRIHN